MGVETEGQNADDTNLVDPGELLHATALVANGQGVLLRGASGSGKSDLALRAIASPISPLLPWPVQLVADDYIRVWRLDAGVVMAAPPQISGKLEARGLGVVDVPQAAIAVGKVKLALVVDLTTTSNAIDRMPEDGHTVIATVRVPVIQLYPFETSAVLKLRLALMAASKRQSKDRGELSAC